MDKNLSLVTVITPTYNRADFLPGVIDSVLAQDYPAIEYIVLDDGSTDDTQSVLRGYDDRIHWESHSNMGEARTVNKGWGMAQGEFVAVINSDDPVLPGLIRTMVDFMKAQPDVLVAYPDWVMIDAEDKPIKNITTYDYDYVDMVRWHHCLPGPGTFVRRTAFALEPWRDPGFRYVGDFEYWMRLGLHGRFARVPHQLATFRFHQGSASNAAKGVLMAKEHIRMLDKFYARSDIPANVRKVRREAYAAASYIAAIQCMSNRDAARWYFLRSILLHNKSTPNGLPRSMDLMMQFILPQALCQWAKAVLHRS
jgi:glycosyltransferase involved in cell wall biosynthesis